MSDTFFNTYILLTPFNCTCLFRFFLLSKNGLEELVRKRKQSQNPRGRNNKKLLLINIAF